MEEIFLQDIAGAQPMELPGLVRKSKRTRFREAIARVLAPVL
jgi:hypothetical protein